LKSSSRAPRWHLEEREDPISVEDGGGGATILAGVISRRPPQSSWLRQKVPAKSALAGKGAYQDGVAHVLVG
jgi:hypothetical protein